MDAPSIAAAWKRRLAGEGFLYRADAPGGNVVKIGFSLDPPRRVYGLNAIFRYIKRPLEISLVAQVPGTWRDELALHKELRGMSLRYFHGAEYYPRSVLSHPAIPADLRPDVYGPKPAKKRRASA